jgi:membrane protein DedA with SNARE-associated domain
MIAAAMPAHLPGVLHTLEPTLNHLGYLAVVGLVLIEDFGVPVPGETVLVLAAVYAGAGRLNILLVALLGFCGAVLGDNIGFAIGHLGGRPLLERYGRYTFLTPARIDAAAGFCDRHGGWIIIVPRFIEGLRQANGIIAGISGIHWAKRRSSRCSRRSSSTARSTDFHAEAAPPRYPNGASSRPRTTC